MHGTTVSVSNMTPNLAEGLELDHSEFESAELDQLEAHLLCRLGGRVKDFRLLMRGNRWLISAILRVRPGTPV